MKKKLSAALATVILSISLGTLTTSAENNSNITTVIGPEIKYFVQASAYSEWENNLIVGFENSINPYETFRYPSDSKPSLDALLSEMPAAIRCIMADGSVKAVPVTWKCVSDDYENSPYYYFQFNPTFDGSGCYVSETASAVPYISVFLNSASSDIALYSASGRANEEVVYQFLRDRMGLNIAEACGVLANIQKESSFNPHAYNPNDVGAESYGICQWRGGRLNSLKSFCASNGYDYTTLQGQLEYLQYEVTNNSYERSQFNKTMGQSEDAEGAYWTGYKYAANVERCAHYYNGVDQYAIRGNLARDTYWPYYSNGVIDCGCSEEYAGYYVCTNAPGGLRIRNGHSTSFSQIGSIPEGATVYVTKTNGTWAHVEYNGVSGYSHMGYLVKKIEPKLVASNTYVDVTGTKSTYVVFTLEEADKQYGLKVISKPENICKVEWADDNEPETAYLVITGKEAAGSGTIKVALYDLDTSETITTVDIAVTADAVERYQITYNMMVRTTDPMPKVITQYKLPGIPYTIPGNIVPHRFGYSFKGWGNFSSSINPDLPAWYKPGDVYTEDKSIELHSTWRRPTVIDVSRSFPTNNYISHIEYPDNYEYYSFTPDETDEYVIKSIGLCDTIGELYSIKYDSEDENKWLPQGTLLATNDDSNYTNSATSSRTRYSKNFSIKYTLNAGQLYFIKVKLSQKTATGSFGVFIDKASHSISFNANGGLNAPPNQIKEYDNDLTLNYNSSNNTYSSVPERDGYTFVGWSLSPNSTTAAYLPGERIESETDMELYAVWEKKVLSPPFIEAAVNGKNVTISWESVEDAINYTVYYIKDGNIPIKYKTTKAASCTIEDMPDGNYEIYVISSDGTDESEKSNVINIKIGSLNGDLNNDGSVDLKDLAVMKYALAADNPGQYADIADLNGDGEVNLKDLAMLKYLISDN